MKSINQFFLLNQLFVIVCRICLETSDEPYESWSLEPFDGSLSYKYHVGNLLNVAWMNLWYQAKEFTHVISALIVNHLIHHTSFDVHSYISDRISCAMLCLLGWDEDITGPQYSI